jgi:hypothetical protein
MNPASFGHAADKIASRRGKSMNNVLRILNCLAIAIFVAISSGQMATAGGGAAFSAGWLIGMGLCLLAPALALLALRTSATPGLRRCAIIASGVQIVLFICLAILPRLGSRMMVPAAIGAVLFGIPFAFNIWRLRAMNRGDFEDSEVDRWYLSRHWRGELPLGIAWWLSGAVTAMLLFAVFGAFGAYVDRMPLRHAARGMLLVFALQLACAIWMGVGVWRSATRQSAEGRRAWPSLAKVSVVAASCGFAFFVVAFLWPPLQENALIAVGRDPLTKISARVTTGQTVLLLHGTFGEGSANVVRRLLAANPGIKTIALASIGGRLREAAEIAALARTRRLNTYVDTVCESACTFVFLAGADRAATPNARVGFHRPSFAGVNPVAQVNATERMLRTYRDAGIPQAFLERVRDTDSTSMWYPSREELIAAGVINRVSLGGETAALGTLALDSKQKMAQGFRAVPMMVAMERHFPGTIDAAAQAAWNEHTQGGTDAEVTTAGRRVISALYPKILATADDQGLEVFARLIVDEMKAAQIISTEACQLLMQGRLNITQALSPDLARREQDWVMAVLERDKLEPRAAVDAGDFQAAIVHATDSMPQERLDAVSDPVSYGDQPKLQCEATIDLYDRVLAQPAPARHLLLRGMFE